MSMLASSAGKLIQRRLRTFSENKYNSNKRLDQKLISRKSQQKNFANLQLQQIGGGSRTTVSV